MASKLPISAMAAPVCRDPETPCGHSPNDDGDHCGHERNEGLVTVSSKIHHRENGMRDGRGYHRDDDKTDEVADRSHDDRASTSHRTRRDSRSNRIRCIVAPFTIITPMLRMAIKRSIGFEASPPKNTLNSNI